MFSKQALLGLFTTVLFATMSEAKRFEFIDANFDDFVNRVLTQDQEKNEFKVYYSTLSKKMQEADEQKRRATFRYLYDLALGQLKDKHAEWFQEINPLVSDAKFVLDEQLDDMRKIIRFFLTRYGAYEEYLNLKKGVEAKAHDQLAQTSSADQGLWESFKSYMNSASNTLAGWFGLGSTTVA
jgi:hypothetical protein